MRLPLDHPQRHELNDEVHARPPEAMTAPLRVSFLALLSEPSQRPREWRQVRELAGRFGVTAPEEEGGHWRADLGPFRLKWERHTEFTRYEFIVSGAGDDLFAEPALRAVPSDWLATLPGRIMAAAHVALVCEQDLEADHEALAVRLFAGNVLVGATIAGGAGEALTDVRIHGDGFSRFVVRDRGMTPRQAGRTVQRLLEIDTYRVMALLALPVARELVPALQTDEEELARITTALATGGDRDEAGFLDRLTRLEAEIGRRAARNEYRFGAAAAYHELVLRRIAELREGRIQGLQTFQEFIERRLAPAMNTCRSTAERQASLLQRAAWTTQLLSTRVNMTVERQNQAVLESMNRRADLQLRLQATVEGLSIAAVTYYAVGLIGTLTEGLNAAGATVDPALAMAVSIPVIALLVALAVRRTRRMIGDH